MPKYACYENVKAPFNRFFSMCDEESIKIGKGNIISYPSGISYEVIGFADTSEEAQLILFPSKADENIAIANYIDQIATQIYK